MTVIAWDGRALAADRRGNQTGLAVTVCKVRRLRDGSIAAHSGSAELGMELFAWLDDGAKPDLFPDWARTEDDSQHIVRILADGSILSYCRSPHPVQIHDQFYAAGCGRDFAMAAMHLGKSAAEAVEVASRFSAGCGNGVDVLTLHDEA